MSADVLMTGRDHDLMPTDRIVDTEMSQPLIQQQLDTNLSIAEGEWFTDVFAGIDWLGYLTDRSVNLNALTQDVVRAMEEIPNVVVRSATADHQGRIVQVYIEGIIYQRPFRLTLLTQQEIKQEKIGSDAIYVPLVLQWGLVRI